MKNWIVIAIGVVAFFIIYSLIDYIFFRYIDWKMSIVSTIIFAVFETICQIYRNKKLNK